MKNALIIFVRIPEAGKVKTRLAATMGQEKALEVYEGLLKHTHSVSVPVCANKFVFYTNLIAEHDLWNNGGFTKKVQGDYDLGGRMKEAFLILFNEGYDNVVIIGSDCPGLSTVIIDEAFQSLKEYEVVIGPATDGGYYLLGMTGLFPFLFENKQWSTERVYEQTVGDLTKKKICFTTLVTLTDVDTEEDWVKTRQFPGCTN